MFARRSPPKHSDVQHNHVLAFHIHVSKNKTQMPKRVIVPDAN
jgi:hypothetical protein